jgi:o-succinylbenzoate---CoA ligase
MPELWRAVDPGDPVAVMSALHRALAGTGPPILPLPPTGTPTTLGEGADLAPTTGTAALVVTSGSTGRPKTVELSAAALQAGGRATHDRLGGPGQWLLALPLSGIAGLQVLTRSLLGGTEPVATEPSVRGAGVSAAIAAMTGSRRYAALVPTQLYRLLAEPEQAAALATLDAVLLGGAAADPGLFERATGAGIRVVATYGMTETCGGCVYDGVPLDRVALALDPDGRIRLAGPVLFSGYLGQPRLTSAVLRAGWFTTSDLGELDDDGRLRVLGRADDVVVVGGRNVALPAVADRLRAHERISDAYCVGIPDPEWGTVVGAVIASDAAPTTVEVQAWVGATLPGAAVPRRVLAVRALPMLTNGKVDRRGLERALLDEVH